MQISIADDDSGVVFSLEVSAGTTVDALKALIEAETRIPPNEQQLLVDMQPI
ncbi:ubiquitin family protein, partial [Toxoplasma gondii ARI]